MLYFIDYFYMQDNNSTYYASLLADLEWKSPSEQYMYLQWVLQDMQTMEAEEVHNSADDWYHLFWIASLLKQVVQ